SVMPSWAGRATKKMSAATVVSGSSRQSAGDEPRSDPAIGNGTPQVIRLEAEATTLPVTAMTQQQKIAAALMKAGISNPAAWAAAGVGVRPKAALAIDAPSESEPISSRAPTALLAKPAMATPAVAKSAAAAPVASASRVE